MIERGAGVIVNVSTMVAEFGLDGMALYGSTKAALELLTKAWSAEFGPKGIRVNAVAPGPVSTEGTAGMREAQGYLASLAPARRLGTAEEIAAAIVYLASPGRGLHPRRRAPGRRRPGRGLRPAQEPGPERRGRAGHLMVNVCQIGSGPAPFAPALGCWRGISTLRPRPTSAKTRSRVAAAANG